IDEDSYAVWDSINDSLAQLSSLLSHTELQNSFHKFGRNLMTKISAKLGWNVIENESHLDTMLRAIVIGRLVNFNNEATISEAKRLFDAHVNGTCVVPADIRASVYRAAAINADDKTFETLLSIYRKTDLQEEKNRVTAAMAFVKDPLKIQKVLEFSLSNEVRSQDAVHVISYVAATKDGCEPAWKFFQDNFKELHRRYEGGFLMCLLVENITKSFSSHEKALEVERFFAQNPVPSADRPLQQSLEFIRLKADWLNRDSAAIKSFLETYNV
ncbi:puromycin-sensitive aminopeptidase-like isoform X2, partial [Leptotrombidium deliense]